MDGAHFSIPYTPPSFSHTCALVMVNELITCFAYQLIVLGFLLCFSSGCGCPRCKFSAIMLWLNSFYESHGKQDAKLGVIV